MNNGNIFDVTQPEIFTDEVTFKALFTLHLEDSLSDSLLEVLLPFVTMNEIADFSVLKHCWKHLG